MKKVLVCVMALLMVFALVACSAASEPATEASTAGESSSEASGEAKPAGDGIEIAYLINSANDTYENYVFNSAKEYCDANGINLTMYDGLNDTGNQLTQLETVCSNGADAVIVVPVDTSGDGQEYRCLLYTSGCSGGKGKGNCDQQHSHLWHSGSRADGDRVVA